MLRESSRLRVKTTMRYRSSTHILHSLGPRPRRQLEVANTNNLHLLVHLDMQPVGEDVDVEAIVETPVGSSRCLFAPPTTKSTARFAPSTKVRQNTGSVTTNETVSYGPSTSLFYMHFKTVYSFILKNKRLDDDTIY